MRALALACCAALLALAACSRHGQPADDPVVARADGLVLHASEARELLQRIDATTRQQLQQDPRLLDRLLRQELGRRALLAEARARQWDQRPDVAAQMQRASSDALLNSYLQSFAAPPAAYPSDAELQSAYQLNQQRLMQPRAYRLAQIYLAVPADSAGQGAAQAHIRKLAAQLRDKPEGFADLARAESEDKASAARGGDLGWVAESQVVPEIRAVVQGLAQGAVSDPILAAGGWHLVRLIDTRPAGVPPLDQVRPELVAALRQQTAQRNAAAYLDKLIQAQHAQVEADASRQLDAARAPTP